MRIYAQSAKAREEIASFCTRLNITIVDAEARLIEIGEDDCAYFKSKCSISGAHGLLYFSMVSLVLKEAISILEVGTGNGNTTRILAKLFPLATIYTIDLPKTDNKFKHLSWRNKNPGLFNQNTNNPRIKFIERNSFFLPSITLPDKLDLIYIDGNHFNPFVAWDTVFAYHHIRKGGFVFWGDYHVGDGNDVRAVINFTEDIIKEEIDTLPLFSSVYLPESRIAWLRKQ